MTIRMFIHQPEVIFRARINMASASYPLDELSFDGTSIGSYTNVFPGMTLRLGTTAGGDNLGRQRVRKNLTSTVIPIGRSSQGVNDGEVDAQDNAWVDVLNDFRVWAKIPYIDPSGEIFKDSDIEIGFWNETPPPVANGGPGFCGTIDPDTGVVTVEFDASDSFEFSGASSGIAGVDGWLWEVGDGTITVGDDEDETITATFPAGFRWVDLTVTNGTGQSHQCHIPVFARDPDNDVTIAHQIVSHRITPAGQEIGIRILQDLPRADYPDGTLVMLWDDALETSDPGRLHMLFVGWEQSNDAGVRAERTGNLRDTVMNCVDVLGRLKKLPGFSQIMENGAPSAWQYTVFPNVLFYLWYLLYWHSTALEVADILLGTQTLNTFLFKILSSDAASLYDQVETLASNITPDHHFTINRRGQMMLVVDPILQYVPDRASTVQDTISAADWSDIRFTYERAPRVHQLRAYAISGGEDDIIPLACLAPGDAPGQGEGYIETSERLTFSQFDLNNNEGNRYARLNAPYGRFTVTAPYSRLAIGIDPAYMKWVNLNIATAHQTQRGLSLINQRGLVHEINIAYDYQPTGLVRTATLTWEMETSGPPAQTLELEEEEGA